MDKGWPCSHTEKKRRRTVGSDLEVRTHAQLEEEVKAMETSCTPGNAHSTQHLHRAFGAAAPTLALTKMGERLRERRVRR